MASGTNAQTPLQQPEQEQRQMQRQREERRSLLRLLAGAYLVYLAYELLTGALKEADWTTMRIVSLLASVVFAAVGVWLAASNLKNALGKPSEQADDVQEGDEKQ